MSSEEVLVVTTNEVAHATIGRVLGPVYGTAVRSRNAWENSLGGLRAAFGRNQGGYTRLLRETRDQAIRELQVQAASLGANAVVGMRFDSGEFDSGRGQSMAEITAYGTAVILETA